MNNKVILKSLLSLIPDSYQTVSINEIKNGKRTGSVWVVTPHGQKTEGLPDRILYGEVRAIVPYYDVISIEVTGRQPSEEPGWFGLAASAVRGYPAGRIWSDGEEILCRTEAAAETVADLFEYLYRNDNGDQADRIHTGYYDPEEDRENSDEYTGWYYVTMD